MVSFKEFLLEAGTLAERQETGFINVVKKNTRNGPISINNTIHGVVNANKMTERNELGTEPYTDVILILEDGSKLNLSLKGGSEEGSAQAPSVAGGGMKGLIDLIPDVVSRFLKTANTWYKRRYKAGDNIPDVYGKLDKSDVLTVLRGTLAMGGPVDYIYIGPMDVIGKVVNNNLTLNGRLFTVKEYAKNHDIYFRIRKRREDQAYDPNTLDKQGNPIIFGKSPSKGDTGRRVVMVSSLPSNASKHLISIPATNKA